MDLVKLLMGPLDKSYCSVFLVLGFISLFLVVSKIIMLFMLFVSPMSPKNKQYKGPMLLLGFTTTLVLLLYYLVFRLAFNICNRVL